MKLTTTSRPAAKRKFLVELGHVAVMADAIGMDALGDFREQHFLSGRPARPGHTGLGVDDDLVGIDGPDFKQRDQRQLGAARVAAGIGDKPRCLDPVAINLGETVDSARCNSDAKCSWPYQCA